MARTAKVRDTIVVDGVTYVRQTASKASEPVVALTRAQAIAASRTTSCPVCHVAYSPKGLATHNANRATTSKPCSAWARKAR